MGSGMASLPGDKPMPPELVEALSTLLADALVAEELDRLIEMWKDRA